MLHREMAPQVIAGGVLGLGGLLLLFWPQVAGHAGHCEHLLEVERLGHADHVDDAVGVQLGGAVADRRGVGGAHIGVGTVDHVVPVVDRQLSLLRCL